MLMVVFYTPIGKCLSCTRKILLITIILLEVSIDYWEFREFVTRELMPIGNMPEWHDHQVIIISWIWENIAPDSPILCRMEDIFCIRGKITKWTFIMSEEFFSGICIVLFAWCKLCHSLLKITNFFYKGFHARLFIYLQCLIERKPADIIHFWFLSRKWYIIRKNCEIEDIEMFMWWDSFFIYWDIMNINMEYIREDCWLCCNPWFLMKFSDCHISHIYFPIAMTSKLYPHLVFLM